MKCQILPNLAIFVRMWPAPVPGKFVVLWIDPITYRLVISDIVFPAHWQLLTPCLGSFWTSDWSLFRFQSWYPSPSGFPVVLQVPLAFLIHARMHCSPLNACRGSNPQLHTLGEENALLGRGCVVEIGGDRLLWKGEGSQHWEEQTLILQACCPSHSKVSSVVTSPSSTRW